MLKNKTVVSVSESLGYRRLQALPGIRSPGLGALFLREKKAQAFLDGGSWYYFWAEVFGVSSLVAADILA